MPSTCSEPLSVLVVDDDSQFLKTLQDILHMRGYAAVTAASGREAVALARGAMPAPAIALIDLRLPDMDGLEVIGRLHAISELTQTIILTGHASVDTAVEALRHQSSDYLVKPIAPALLLNTVERAGERWQRRRAEEALRESEERSQILLENISDVILVVDEALTMQYVSPSVTRVLGRAPAELKGQRCSFVAHQDDMAAIEGIVRNRAQAGLAGEALDLRWRHQSGEWRLLEVTAANLKGSGLRAGVVLTGRDVTEKRRLERELVQAQKMESIGRLAGGVAHDFNNLLTAIIGFGEILLEEMSPADSARQDIRRILKAAGHGASLTRQLLAFSRRQVLELTVVDIAELIQGLAPILERLLGEDVHTHIASDPHLNHVKVDRGQLEQVVINLAVNARDAMPDGGALTIEARNVIIDRAYVHERPYARPGPHVMLAVRDTGTGMDAATRARIFEPFFTTKPLGQGTGLGLSTVYGIVKQSGGHIEVESEVGQGSTFQVYLPITDHDLDATLDAEPSAAGLVGTESILLVEDDPDLRALLGRTLTRHGYQLAEAATGTEALDVIRNLAVPIDLLLTDAVLPELSGPALAREAATLRPGIRVLFVSGYTDDARLRLGMMHDNEGFLQKPFGAATLLQKVRQQLDRASGSTAS